MANYLASIFGTEQDKVRKPLAYKSHKLIANILILRLTAVSTTKSARADMATAVLESMSNHHTRKRFSSQTCIRILPSTPRTR